LDPRRVYQALVNLAKSALQSARGGTLEIGARRRGSDVEFCISNGGGGAKAGESPPKAAEFLQGNGPIYGYRGGRLALNLSKRLIELHRGKLRVDLKDNETRIFWFTLPINGQTTST